MSQTPLYAAHLDAGAKMVDFHGWDLPLHYGSQIAEHHAVRKDCGMFDVSHMTVVDVLGAGGRLFLRNLLANDVDKFEHPGEALYACMLNEHGGIIDDLIVYFRSADNYRLVLNAATREKDIAWLKQCSEDYSVWLQERPELALLAIQGPKTLEKLTQVLDPSQIDAITTLKPFQVVEVQDWFIARTGYTGEDGFEIILPSDKVNGLWQALLKQGATPCGLGARDSLRLEAGMMLSGQDMDETTTPYESGLGWTVKLDPQDRDFIGRGALTAQKQQGVAKKMVGLILEDKGVMRPGFELELENGEKGVITSGGFSPTLEASIALARVPKTIGEQVKVKVRNKLLTAKVSKPRFVKNGQPLV